MSCGDEEVTEVAGRTDAERPPTVQETVLRQLRRSILGGDLAPGSQILQQEIAARLGVSRVPVRDALRTLEGQGLVTYSSHRGYHVRQVDITELLEIQDIRDILEGEALCTAVDRVEDTTFDRMQEHLDAMTRAEDEQDWTTWSDAHREFHFTLFAASGMRRLMRILDRLWDASDIYRSYYMRTGSARSRTSREHHDLLAAARSRDTGQLLTLLAEHHRGTVHTIRGSLTDETR
ncbi:MAG: FCD domain-containing protein [Streptosporangiales bacterium]|nr:FCD domain-containing protein [Streptosporangiales bacterium]